MIARASILVLPLLLLSGPPLPAQAKSTKERFPVPCGATPPATIRASPATWLGDCVAGKAEGLGILRVGARAPFAFLLGRMKAGRPVSGMVMHADETYEEAMAFDPQGRTISADGEHIPEQDAIWADAARAARMVGDRFAAVGNRGSAAYYRHFAYSIEHDRPE